MKITKLRIKVLIRLGFLETKRYCDKSQDFARQGKPVKGDRTKRVLIIRCNKKDHQKMAFFVGGDEEIRTLVPRNRQPHFECGSL